MRIAGCFEYFDVIFVLVRVLAACAFRGGLDHVITGQVGAAIRCWAVQVFVQNPMPLPR